VPLTPFQTEVLRTLAASRSEDSFFGGGAVLNAKGVRLSKDFDIFHDKADKLLRSVGEDEAALARAGLSIDWTIRQPTMHRGVVRRASDTLLLDWAVDSDFRFFPIERDPEFGFRLHPADIATNKLLAAIGRDEPRDIVDIMQLHHRFLPLGAIAWAAAGKDPGLTPDFILGELKRASRYQQSDLDMLDMIKSITARDVSLFLRKAGREAGAWVKRMPPEQVGCVYIDKTGKLIQPDPEHLGDVTAHRGRRGGHWPTSSALQSLMLERGADGIEE